MPLPLPLPLPDIVYTATTSTSMVYSCQCYRHSCCCLCTLRLLLLLLWLLLLLRRWLLQYNITPRRCNYGTAADGSGTPSCSSFYICPAATNLSSLGVKIRRWMAYNCTNNAPTSFIVSLSYSVPVHIMESCKLFVICTVIISVFNHSVVLRFKFGVFRVL